MSLRTGVRTALSGSWTPRTPSISTAKCIVGGSKSLSSPAPSRAFSCPIRPTAAYTAPKSLYTRRRPQHASYATAPSEPSTSTSLTEDEYNELADRDMDTLHESVEVLCEEFGPPEWEVEYSSGVMTIRLPPHGTYVINKQPPNQQIWISSPISGPSRFGWDPSEEAWAHHRIADVRLGKLLEKEIRELSGKSGVVVEEWEGTGLK